MKRNRLHTLAAFLACASMVVPHAALAVQPAQQAQDIELRADGVLVGQVVDLQGAPQANVAVSILQGEREVVRTTTDENGLFAAQQMRGGQYQFVTEQGFSVYRVWAPNTAPPAAGQTALVVNSPDLVRGQDYGYYGQGCMDWIRCHPYLTAGIVASAIVIPLALADDDWGS